MMLKQSEKKFYKGCQADNSLTMELEVRMPVLKSQKSISSSFQPPASTLHPRKFSYRQLSVSMSVMECREGRKEEGKKGQKGGMGAGWLAKLKCTIPSASKEGTSINSYVLLMVNLFRKKKNSIPSGFENAHNLWPRCRTPWSSLKTPCICVPEQMGKNIPGIPDFNSKQTQVYTEYSTCSNVADAPKLILSEKASHNRINTVRE